MEYSIYLYTNALEVSNKISKNSESVKSLTLFYMIFGVKEIADHISQYIRLIDFYSLKRASKYFQKGLMFFSSLYKLDNFANVQLKDKSLFDRAVETQAVISGSFILRLLLSTPYSMPFWRNEKEPSDIDIYSYPMTIRQCPTCKTKIGSISKISTYLCNGQCMPDGHNNSEKTSSKYDGLTSIFNVWKFTINEPNSSKIIYNDIALYEDEPISEFIRKDFDLDFCKNFFDVKLHILYPETVLKMKCPYRMKNSRAGIHNIFGRIIKYTERGFTITLSKKLLIEFNKYKNKYYLDTVTDMLNDPTYDATELKKQITNAHKENESH